MFNRVLVHVASGSGGGGRAHLGYASGMSGMRCRLHNLNNSMSGVENALTPLDYLTITAISQDVVTAVSLSGKTYTEYAFFTSVPHNDNFLTGTGAQNWPSGTSPAHYPYR